MLDIDEKISDLERRLELGEMRQRNQEWVDEGNPHPWWCEARLPSVCVSPIAFNLYIESIVRTLENLGRNLGFKDFYKITTTLAYADDPILVVDKGVIRIGVTRNKEALDTLLDALSDQAAKAGLRMKPQKCATLHLLCRGRRRVLPTPFKIEGAPAPAMTKDESYLHLGVPTGFAKFRSLSKALQDLETEVEKIDESLLTPWQKIDVIKTFVYPKLDFILRGAPIHKTNFGKIDRLITFLANKWLNLPKRASNEVLFIPPSQGGAGLLPFCDRAELSKITQAFKILMSKDANTENLAKIFLKWTLNRKLGRSASGKDIVDYLSVWKQEQKMPQVWAGNETLPYVLQHCRMHSAAWKRRHDAVLERLRKALRVKEEVRINQRLPNSSSPLKPDLVIIEKDAKKVTMVDAAIPFENRNEALSAARAEKIKKYEALAEELWKDGYKVDLEAFLVGSLGGWDNKNERALKMLEVSPRGPATSMWSIFREGGNNNQPFPTYILPLKASVNTYNLPRICGPPFKTLGPCLPPRNWKQEPPAHEDHTCKNHMDPGQENDQGPEGVKE
ncbi:hypothetical protein LAZ67_X002952 [Cordylochernes scorpioides]|uniref:Reverse transcriptase domain-containing protein n=1 Tax=Cordylochernes scorpioides TaxID=51811 RepID=A0ABY6LU83_9ARAC|nr:hypothetical protein LAZ67_X002952 [Cordylochernes scorpioides]